MAFKFAHLQSAACGGAARRWRALRARFWGAAALRAAVGAPAAPGALRARFRGAPALRAA